MFRRITTDARHRHGDTLVEVTLAIGIFSMVAVAAVSVLSTSTSSAEDTLEANITREQIDAQADALRFIQSAAVVDQNTATPKFARLWDKIKNNAITIEGAMAQNKLEVEELLQYVPDSCEENYSSYITRDNAVINNNAYNKAFIIDPNKLSSYAEEADMNKANELLDKVYIDKSTKNNTSGSIIVPTSTYPRLIYSNGASSNTLLGNDIDGDLSLAEGIYVVAVKDSRDSTADYYDFYIRTCWYGTDDSERPSTISTVIRLNDLDATKYEVPRGTFSYQSENLQFGTVTGSVPSGTVQSYGKTVTITATPNSPEMQFLGWYSPSGELYSKEPTLQYVIQGKKFDLVAKFGFEIKVLNVYPPEDPAPTILGASANSLKTWMAKWGVNEEADGVKKLTVDPVPIKDFNANPYKYLGSRGNWNYDIIVFGFWDYNGKEDLSASSATATRDFLTHNGSALFGHDTLDASSCDSSGTYFHPYFYSLIDLMALECEAGGHMISDEVKIVKSGVFTEYPYTIGKVGTVLTIPPAHRTRYRSHGTVWLQFEGWPEKPANENFYLASYDHGHTAFINTGHSNGQATEDERKIIANVLFYLYTIKDK